MKLIFHLGYPKTGTTLLQSSLFPFHSEINYLGPKYYIGYGAEAKKLAGIPDDENYKVLINFEKIIELEKLYDGLFVKKNIEKKDINNLINLNFFSQNKVNVFSDEIYLFYNGGRNSKMGEYFLGPREMPYHQTKYRKYHAPLVLMKILQQNFKDLKIGIFYTIRNQYDLIRSSFYQHKIQMDYFLSYKNFEDLIANINTHKEIKDDNLYHYFKSFDFNYTYDQIKLKFPNADIKILKFEDLTKTLKIFF